jgi:pimeloyl-ACP methyl ester carboxylesterase
LILDLEDGFKLQISLREFLKKVRAPTIIINGTNDLSTPVKFAQELNNGISGSKLVLVDEDHMFIRTKPDLLIKNIIEFLDENRELY